MINDDVITDAEYEEASYKSFLDYGIDTRKKEITIKLSYSDDDKFLGNQDEFFDRVGAVAAKFGCEII